MNRQNICLLRAPCASSVKAKGRFQQYSRKKKVIRSFPHDGDPVNQLHSTEPESVKPVAEIEDDPIAAALPERATFIPLRHTDLRMKLVELFSLDADQRKSFDRLCTHLQAIFHVEHLSILLQLEEIYCHLDPDTELLDLQTIGPIERHRLTQDLVDRVSSVLFSAHYKRLTREELERAIEIGCQWGVRLDVDFSLFDQLEIFARGYRTVTITRRRWQNLFFLETIELPEFHRLIMVFRIRPQTRSEIKRRGEQPFNTNCVYLKTFKNIPETDLEILLPGSQIRLTHFDKAKILLPTISGGVITLYKVFRSALVLTVAFTYSAILGWIIFLGASGGYIVKSVLSYFRTKTKYQFGLTKSLYIKNLDNNLSAIYRILNEAEEQELCEAILAYTLLWQSPDPRGSGFNSQQLDLIAERFLLDVTEIDVDFEVHDALGKLARLGMATVDIRGNWRAVEPGEALISLDKNWRELLQSETGIGDLPPIER